MDQLFFPLSPRFGWSIVVLIFRNTHCTSVLVLSFSFQEVVTWKRESDDNINAGDDEYNNYLSLSLSL